LLIVLVGGFFGDEGKGKIGAYLSLADKPKYAVRTGSINAGHTVYYEGKVYKLRSVPSGFVSPTTTLLIAPGALVRLDVTLGFREPYHDSSHSSRSACQARCSNE